MDAMKPSDYVDLRDAALEELGRRWSEAETVWTWPTQYMVVLVQLAAKPDGAC